ncbi:hypothetical protein D3C86_1651640 [compost metagenome]
MSANHLPLDPIDVVIQLFLHLVGHPLTQRVPTFIGIHRHHRRIDVQHILPGWRL